MQTHLRAETEIKRLHLKNARNEVHVAMEDSNFLWSAQEVRDFRYLWREGRPITDIADYFKRTQEEVTVLAMDQALREFIKPRKGGIFGNC